MTSLPILLVGAGGHAAACIDVLEEDDRYRIGGLVGFAAEVGKCVSKYPVIGTDKDLPALAAKFHYALIAVGQIKTPEPRIKLYEQLLQIGFEMTTIVSPRAYVSRTATVGSGTIIMHGAIVNAGSNVGENCIINTQSLVEHDAQVGDHCHISTAAIINGGANIGAGTFVGSGAVVREETIVGERCLIGMGQRVLRDCAAGTRVPGTFP